MLNHVSSKGVIHPVSRWLLSLASQLDQASRALLRFEAQLREMRVYKRWRSNATANSYGYEHPRDFRE